jgi:uncharacterized protein (DUF2336 family)
LGTGDYDQRIVEQPSARSLVGDTNADANLWLTIGLPMNAAMNLLSRVDDAIASGSLGRRAEMLRHVTDLFVIGSPQCTEEDVAVFDSVFTRLAAEIEMAARALLSTRLAPIPNAPPITVRALALDDAIEVAGPVLKQSGRLEDATLIEVASTKGPEHLLAISQRPSLSEAVTEVLIVRGDQMVVLSTAENRGANFSEAGYTTLVRRAEGDERLTLVVAARPEIPLHYFLHLLDKASDAVRAKLEAVYPQAKHQVREAVSEVAGHIESDVLDKIRDHAAAMAFTEALHRVGQLDDERLRSFAQSGRYAETVAALAVMSELSLSFIEQAMRQERAETIVVVTKALALSWQTAKAVLALRVRNGNGSSNQSIDELMASFERLKTATARELVRFYRQREQHKPARRSQA